MPGQSGNPGGRPKGLASQILDRYPTTSADLVTFWRMVAFGTSSSIERKYGVPPTLKDRISAAGELADRLHGKPMQTHEVTGPQGGPISHRSMDDAELDARIADLERQLKPKR